MRSTWNIFVLVIYTALALNASVQGLVHGLALRPMLQRASLPLDMRIDYGTGYNPHHRPVLGIYPESPLPSQRPRIDYGSGYDPRNRPVSQSGRGGHVAATKSRYASLLDSTPETPALCQSVLVLKICLDLSRGDTVESTKPVDYSMSFYDPARRNA